VKSGATWVVLYPPPTSPRPLFLAVPRYDPFSVFTHKEMALGLHDRQLWGEHAAANATLEELRRRRRLAIQAEQRVESAQPCTATGRQAPQGGSSSPGDEAHCDASGANEGGKSDVGLWGGGHPLLPGAVEALWGNVGGAALVLHAELGACVATASLKKGDLPPPQPPQPPYPPHTPTADRHKTAPAGRGAERRAPFLSLWQPDVAAALALCPVASAQKEARETDEPSTSSGGYHVGGASGGYCIMDLFPAIGHPGSFSY
jgi:hypothetical protein